MLSLLNLTLVKYSEFFFNLENLCYLASIHSCLEKVPQYSPDLKHDFIIGLTDLDFTGSKLIGCLRTFVVKVDLCFSI